MTMRTRQETSIMGTSSPALSTAKLEASSESYDENSGKMRSKVGSTKIRRRQEKIRRNRAIPCPPISGLCVAALLLVFLSSTCPGVDAASIVSSEIEQNELSPTEQYVEKEILSFNEAPRGQQLDTSYSSDYPEYAKAEYGWKLTSYGDESIAAEEREIISSTQRRMPPIEESSKIYTNDDKSDFRVKFYLAGARAQTTADAKERAKEIAKHLRTLRRVEIDLQFEMCVAEGIFILGGISDESVGVLQKVLQCSDKILHDFAATNTRLRRLESTFDNGERANNDDRGLRGVSPSQDRNTGASRDAKEIFSERNLNPMSDSIFYTELVAPIVYEIIDLAAFENDGVRSDTKTESNKCAPYLVKTKSVLFVDFDYDKELRDIIKRNIIKDFQKLLPQLALSDQC